MAWRPRLVIGLGAGLLAIAGCSGKMSTQRLSDQAMSSTDDEIRGVVFFQPAVFAEVTLRTTYVRDGKYIGRSTDASPACVEVMAEKAVTMPDLKKPYAIRYDPGMFETNTFGVTLKDGMLAGVNAAPTATQSPSLLPAPPLGGALMPLGLPAATPGPNEPPRWGGGVQHVQLANERPACNDGPVLIGYRRIEIP